jgi:periplasmic copper chaperone A
MKRRTLLAFFLLPATAWAHSYKLGSLAIGHAWIMASPVLEASAMVPIVNGGTEEDSLVEARSEIATLVELRDGDKVVSEFALEPNTPFSMRAASKHLQLIGLKQPLVKGDRVAIVLKFKSAGETTIEFHVNDKAGE